MPRAAAGASTARAAPWVQRRPAFMEHQPLRYDTVVARCQPDPKRRLQTCWAAPGQISGMARLLQKPEHRPRPRFVLALAQRLEFPQVMRITQGVGHTV